MNLGTLLIQVFINGLTVGSSYILMALGFTMIFGILRVINFAHGEFYMLGALTAYYFLTQFGVNYWIAVLLAMLIIGLLGYLVEKILFHPIRHDEMRTMILALGLSITVQNLGVIVAGPEDLSINSPVSGILQVGKLTLPEDRLMVVGVTIVVLIVFYYFLHFTKIGLALRALAQDEEAAKAQGINTKRIYAFGFGIGTALAAVAGVLMGTIYSVSPFMGSVSLLKAFVVVILGGLGSIPGAILGGLVLAMGESFASTFIGSSTASLFGFLLVIVILIVKPSGFFGLKEG